MRAANEASERKEPPTARAAGGERITNSGDATYGRIGCSSRRYHGTDAKLKTWRTLQAEFLLAGYCANLIEGDDGRPLLIVSRWSFCKSFDQTAHAREFLERVSGRGARR